MRQRFTIALSVLLLLPVSVAVAQNNQCDEPGEAPDVIIGALFDKARYGTVDGYTAFSIGTESCNIGTCWLNWLGTDHPVIAQNMFRFKDGRFEQIGQSWLKHGFATLNGSLCSNNCIPADGSHLGVNCSDPYWATLNGSQSNLGPKFEVDPAAGTHVHPFTDQGMTGNAIYKRLQVANADLDPALNPGAVYYVEGQYVTRDDAEAENNWNNNSFRQVIVSGSGSTFDITLTGPTMQQQAAIWAWQDNDPAVLIKDIAKEYLGGAKATDLGDGTWHYEYALQNVVSTDAARALIIPVPHGAQITNIDFHAPPYHSGEPYDNTPWTAMIDTSGSPNTLTFSTETHAENPDASALRWGTLYNFSFDIDFPPTNTKVTIGQFLPGSNARTWPVLAPDLCGDAFCDVVESESLCPEDCADLGSAGEVTDDPADQLLLERDGVGDIVMNWGQSCLVGDADYEIYEGTLGDFGSHGFKTCTTSGLTTATIAPVAGNTYYLVVPNNGDREGSYGLDSDGTPRPQGSPACMVQSVASCP